VWTACGDSIVRAFDAKSGSLKRQFVGHEAAVNCMTITGGKLYTGSSDGTLRIWDAKDVADDGLGDDGPPPPVPTEAEGEDVAAVVDGDAATDDTPAEESEAVPEEENSEETVEDIENGEGETPAEGEEPAGEEGEEGETPPAEDGEEAPAEEEPAKDADDIDAMEQELADAAG